jgi:hypothetical protein
MNPGSIRPKKMNIKELLRIIEEIYSFKFENKVDQHLGLQDTVARFIVQKFKTKPKIDQSAMDFIISLEYHK